MSRSLYGKGQIQCGNLGDIDQSVLLSKSEESKYKNNTIIVNYDKIQ